MDLVVGACLAYLTASVVDDTVQFMSSERSGVLTNTGVVRIVRTNATVTAHKNKTCTATTVRIGKRANYTCAPHGSTPLCTVVDIELESHWENDVAMVQRLVRDLNGRLPGETLSVTVAPDAPLAAVLLVHLLRRCPEPPLFRLALLASWSSDGRGQKVFSDEALRDTLAQTGVYTARYMYPGDRSVFDDENLVNVPFLPSTAPADNRVQFFPAERTIYVPALFGARRGSTESLLAMIDACLSDPSGSGSPVTIFTGPLVAGTNATVKSLRDNLFQATGAEDAAQIQETYVTGEVEDRHGSADRGRVWFSTTKEVARLRAYAPDLVKLCHVYRRNLGRIRRFYRTHLGADVEYVHRWDEGDVGSGKSRPFPVIPLVSWSNPVTYVSLS